MDDLATRPIKRCTPVANLHAGPDDLIPTANPAAVGAPTPVPGAGWVVGRFRVEKELGRGGMGVVLLARDPDLNRPVALKLLREDHPETLARFRLEAHALAGLAHPNAVRVFEFGEHAGRPFLAMEYVPGQTLNDALRTGPLDPVRAAALLAPVAEAVHAAHDLGVVHRDLKPANVLLTEDDTPKLTDFGVARRLDGPGLTATNEAVGTPGYMAPEQAAGKAPDARTDVYGLGATLYECLTGRPPFVGPTAAVFQQVLLAEPLSPLRLNPAVPRDLDTVCLKCLEKDPARRYQTAAELAADLDRFLAGQPILARPVGLSGRMVKWGRRNKPLAVAILAAALAVVGGTTGATVQAVRATRARDAEAAERRRADEQAAEAVAAQRKAEEKSAEADAVSRFLTDDLLRQASGKVQVEGKSKPDPNLTVRAALDRAAEKVDERFADRPNVANRVRNALAAAYRGVGEYDKAVAQYRAALASYQARFGPDNVDALYTMGLLSTALGECGRRAECLPLDQDRLDRCRRVFGPDDPGTLSATAVLATTYIAVGRHADALPLYQEALAGYRRIEGPDGKQALVVANNLAEAFKAMRRPADALALHREVYAVRLRTLGPDHPHTLTSTVSLGYMLATTGREAEGRPLLEDGLRRRRAALGPDHPQTAHAANALANIHNQAGRHADALPLYEECLPVHRKQFGPTHPTTLQTLSSVAFCLSKAGRHADAVPLYEECLALRRQALGPTHRETLTTLDNLGVALRQSGRHAEAVAAGEECVNLCRQAFGPADPETLEALQALAKSLLAAGRPADARSVCEELVTRRAARTPADPMLAAARRMLAECKTLAPMPRPAR